MATQKRTSTSSQLRTRTAIIDAAAKVLSEQGMGATLDDVACEAALSRATLYRYFASRDELIVALSEVAYREVVDRVRDAGLDEVPFLEGIKRVARAAANTGDHYVFLQNDHFTFVLNNPDQEYEETMLRFFERGQREGYLRADLPVAWLRGQYRAIVTQALRYVGESHLGVEETADLIADQFLHGAAPRD